MTQNLQHKVGDQVHEGKKHDSQAGIHTEGKVANEAHREGQCPWVMLICGARRFAHLWT